MASPLPSNARRRASIALGLGIAALLVCVYVRRLTATPLEWEEARRCVVSYEMIDSGDYVVPTVAGEPYRKKPPMLNWILAAASGFDRGRVGAGPLRAISVAAVFGMAALLTILAVRRRPPSRWPWLAGAMALTAGIFVQYGRRGEIDPLFVLWTTGALAFYELGRRSRRPWIRWVPSQAMVAGGFLTKGLSPLFFYPPVLIHAWLERRLARRSGRAEPSRSRLVDRLAFATGLVVAAGLVALWLVPYANRGGLRAILAVAAREVGSRTASRHGSGALLLHLATYPFVALANLSPWPLLLLGLASARVRTAARSVLRRDAYARFALVAAAWSFLAIWVSPGALGRYAMPAYPFALAVAALVVEEVRATGDLPQLVHFAIGLGVAWVVASFVSARAVAGVEPWSMAAFGVAAIALVALAAPRRGAPPRMVTAVLLFGLLYGSFYASVTEVARSRKRASAEESRRAVAEMIRNDARARALDPAVVPIACAKELSPLSCFPMMTSLGRVVRRPPLPAGRAGYVVAPRRRPPLADGELVGEVADLRLTFVPAR